MRVARIAPPGGQEQRAQDGIVASFSVCFGDGRTGYSSTAASQLAQSILTMVTRVRSVLLKK